MSEGQGTGERRGQTRGRPSPATGELPLAVLLQLYWRAAQAEGDRLAPTVADPDREQRPEPR